MPTNNSPLKSGESRLANVDPEEGSGAVEYARRVKIVLGHLALVNLLLLEVDAKDFCKFCKRRRDMAGTVGELLQTDQRSKFQQRKGIMRHSDDIIHRCPLL